MRLYNKVQVLKVLNDHLGVYPTPINLNWSWGWGSLSGILLGSQIVTGILLAMHYVGHVDHAFASVQHLMVDVPSGIILRYAHANGASLFFTVVYLHVLRGIYYSSGNQPREIVWISGVVIMLLMIITAFIGYVLPWGYYLASDVLIETPYLLNFVIPLTKLKPIEIDSITDWSKKNGYEIISISVGSLLGDCFCENRSQSGNARLTFKQSRGHGTYILWIHQMFIKQGLTSNKPLILKKVSLKYTGLNYEYYRFNTYTRPLFGILHKIWLRRLLSWRKMGIAGIVNSLLHERH